jgi:hypothetical protein
MARSIDQRLAALRSAPKVEELRDALRSTTGVLVAAAAKHVAEYRELVAELPEAFARLCEQPVKRDPGCRGKVAIARALHDLEQWEGDVFATGVRHVQREPAFGEPVDTAGELRGLCGLAHAHFGRDDALDVLGELLADPKRNAREGAARGIGDAGRPDAGALLRFKLLIGDAEPEVLAACFESLLHLGNGVDFALRMLAGHDARAEAAAVALGARRDARATAPLIAWCGAVTQEQRRRVGYVALALLRDEPAIAHLLEVVREGPRADAVAAAKALSIFKDDPALIARLRSAAPAALRGELEALL